MKPEENIGKLIKKLHITPRAEMHQKTLSDLFEAQDNFKKAKSVVNQPKIFRTIMGMKITKFSAAAVLIIITVLIGINQFFDGPIDGVSATLADTLETMRKMPWVHVITESETLEGKETIESWMSFESKIRASKGTRVVTVYTNYSKGKKYLYSPRDPYSNKIRITPLSPIDDLFKHPDSPVELITRVLENAKKRKSKITREKSTLGGTEVEVIRITHGNSETTLFRDIKRNLLIRMDMEGVTMRKEKTSKESKAGISTKAHIKGSPTTSSIKQYRYKYKHLYDYPDQGPKDIYALGAPRNAQIDNYCPTGDVADIFAEVRQRIHKAYEGFVAIIIESESLDSNPEQQKIILMRNRIPDKPQFLWSGLRFLAWFHPSSFTLNTNIYNTTYEMLPADSERDGLIGFKVLQIQKSSIKRTIIDEYWLDRERDYLVMEHIRFENHMNRYWDSTKKTITLATKQTPDGQWYPSHISYEWKYSDDTGQHKQKIDKQIILKKEPVFPDDDFKIEYIFNVE